MGDSLKQAPDLIPRLQTVRLLNATVMASGHVVLRLAGAAQARQQRGGGAVLDAGGRAGRDSLSEAPPLVIEPQFHPIPSRSVPLQRAVFFFKDVRVLFLMLLLRRGISRPSSRRYPIQLEL